MHARFDDPSTPIPQAIQRSLANFEGLKQDNCLHGASLIAQNSNSAAYVLKKGLIRVLPKTTGTGSRFLLRQHSADTVTDVVFFHSSSDVLATVSHTKLVMWKFESVLLEIQSQVPLLRVVWHPLDINKFWILDASHRAVFVDSTNLHTEPEAVHGYNVAQLPDEGTVIPDVADLCWHSEGRVVTISASSAFLLVWKDRPHLTLLHKVPVVGAPVQRCMSLGENHIVTLQKDGTLSVWDTSGKTLQVHQVVQLAAAASNFESLLMTVASEGSESPYIVVCSRDAGKVYVMEFANGSIKSVNIVETAEPCYAISSARALPTLHSDDTKGLDVEFVAYHPNTVQTITVPWTLLQQQQQGITVRPLQTMTPEVVFDDYEVEDEEADDHDGAIEPQSSAEQPSIQNNPFANWLGAIAAKNAPSSASSTPPPPPPPSFLVDPPRTVASSSPSPSFLPSVNYGAPIPPSTPSVLPSPPPHVMQPPKVPTPPPQVRKEITPPPAPVALMQQQEPAAADNAALSNTIRQVVQEELRSIVLPKLPNNKKQNKGSNPPTQEEMQAMVESAQASTVKRVLIPAVESITAQVLEKVSEHLEKQQNRSDNTKNQLESMSKQLSKMTALVSELTKEVHRLGDSSTNGQSPRGKSQQQQTQQQRAVDDAEVARQNIRKLLQQGKIPEAFVAALHAGSEMTLFCCQNSDIKTVLDADPPLLNQGVLLCIMQHLATLLNGKNMPTVELEWLQELALSFDKTDPAVQQHWPQVVQEVLGYLVQRQQRQEPALKRPLQRLVQIVRGL